MKFKVYLIKESTQERKTFYVTVEDITELEEVIKEKLQQGGFKGFKFEATIGGGY